MRNFTDSEKEFIKQLIKYKYSDDTNNLRGMSLLLEYLDCCFYLIEIKIFAYPKNKTVDDAKEYVKYTDFSILVKKLIEHQYIEKIDVPTDRGKNSYVNRKYEVNRSPNSEDYTQFTMGGLQNFESDLQNLLLNSILYPTSLLEELVKNDFTSIDQRRFNSQMFWTRLSVFLLHLQQ